MQIILFIVTYILYRKYEEHLELGESLKNKLIHNTVDSTNQTVYIEKINNLRINLGINKAIVDLLELIKSQISGEEQATVELVKTAIKEYTTQLKFLVAMQIQFVQAIVALAYDIFLIYAYILK